MDPTGTSPRAVPGNQQNRVGHESAGPQTDIRRRGRRVRTAIRGIGRPSGGSDGAGNRAAPEARRQQVLPRRPRVRGGGCRRRLLAGVTTPKYLVTEMNG
jgi:hypothetical protein